MVTLFGFPTQPFSFVRPLQDNIRALLSTVHTVLWEGSGWTPPGMTDLVEAGKVKRQYMKVNLIIHPDKVSNWEGKATAFIMPAGALPHLGVIAAL